MDINGRQAVTSQNETNQSQLPDNPILNDQEQDSQNSHEEAAKYRELLKEFGMYYRPMRTVNKLEAVKMFRRLDKNHMKTLNIDFTKDGTLDGRTQLAKYFKDIGFDFDDFSDKPGTTDMFEEIFEAEANQSQHQKLSLKPTLNSQTNSALKMSVQAKELPKTSKLPFQSNLHTQKPSLFKQSSASEGAQHSVSESSTSIKDNKWEKKGEVKEIQIEKKVENFPQKITKKFAFAVFNTMQVTYETPKLQTKIHKILDSEENRLSDSEKYSLNGEDEVIKCIIEGNKLSKEGLEYFRNIKQHYKEVNFPKKIELQFSRVIKKLEDSQVPSSQSN
ncbi:hypothetical protein TVAG_306500 [Trichomonas vaginalis G3]|uniref:Uncharacterized protein n=1 Tax=Trichomonas vaginalis (strain ATCC PRA-98 / G3) TaxID=412133 RepID=A2DNE0_TRIV3|nr:hypothetical protein TVAGG3_1024670 [Trichomonas vaginalis G3]EAY18128.1 hypothetical protein TVAG_306500 [Trichomonas vaginalis G3]KAI5492405.1 hypothetical protein TVAGG3_1024670 [Trichomonas vaginalis G3]|eukprot:XP_001579114.1 hypothetical protein [Trichomonas vaginalis G3]